jgi:hypothetical protein
VRSDTSDECDIENAEGVLHWPVRGKVEPSKGSSLETTGKIRDTVHKLKDDVGNTVSIGGARRKQGNMRLSKVGVSEREENGAERNQLY